MWPFKSKYQLAEPGIDPISNPLPHTGGGEFKLGCTWLLGIGFVISLFFGFVVRPLLSAKAAPRPTANVLLTITNTPTQVKITPTPTIMITPTVTKMNFVLAIILLKKLLRLLKSHLLILKMELLLFLEAEKVRRF